jgi:hypothetical protein
MYATRNASRLAALILGLAICACAARHTGDDGYKVVQQDVTYGPNEKRDREWRALMVATDECHQSGFTDAQPTAAPQTRCLDIGESGCVRFSAHLSWDCIGMGYQSN